jgi:hypothetical protein
VCADSSTETEVDTGVDLAFSGIRAWTWRSLDPRSP